MIHRQPVEDGEQHDKRKVQGKALPAHDHFQCTEIRDLSSGSRDHERCSGSYAHAVHLHPVVAAEAACTVVTDGCDAAMNRFNGKLS